MITGKKFICILAAVALVMTIWFFLIPTEEQQIKKQLHLFTKLTAKHENEPTLTALKKTVQIHTLFTADRSLTIRTPEMEGNYSRKELTDRITLARNAFTSLKISLHDISIQFSAETAVEVLLTMRLQGKMGAEVISDVQEVRTAMEKQEGKWVFTGVEIVEVLKR